MIERVCFAWWPRRIALRVPATSGGSDNLRFIGWVWLQRTLLFNNISHGWIAFAEDQTEGNLSKCPTCGKSFRGNEHE